MFKTPILFIVFNRLESAKKVFAKIKEIQPSNLYLAADGPREEATGESEKCESVKTWLLENIDWDCNLHTNFQTKNKGCGKHVSGAITWFFEHVEEGIILEDDCIPDLSFFHYSAVLLEKYRDNAQVFVIGGNNFQDRTWGDASYYFSAYGHIWGWATWKRAWKHYDFELKSISEKEIKKALQHYSKSLQQQDFWMSIFRLMKNNAIDTWDYQWTFSQWVNGAVNIMPNYNLITNIGFDEDATHTKIIVDGISNRKSVAIETIKHPSKIKINSLADKYSFYNSFEQKKKNYFFKKCREKSKYTLKQFFKRDE
jgi:hypothetical protein